MTPDAIVRLFLERLEARDLRSVASLLAPGATLTFPGGVVFHEITALANWSKDRYRFVRKTIDAIDVIDGPITVAYCRGTLSGEWPDGTAFSGIRFIDRFEIKDQKITGQHVWNDLAEIR